MIAAYVFPPGCEPGRANIGRARPVNVDSDYDELLKARDQNRLCCVFLGCLEPVNLVHRDGTLNHFRHHPRTDESPLCPYRSDKISGSQVARDRLYHALRLRHSRHAGVQIHEDPTGQGIAVEGLEPGGSGSALILPLLPSMLGSSLPPEHVHGRQVLYLIAEEDLGALNARRAAVDEILARRPAVLVHTDLSEQQRDTYVLLDRLPPPAKWQETARGIESLDLVALDGRELLGLKRPPEILFIDAAHRSEILSLQQRLSILSIPIPVLEKLLRLLLKRLWVDGAGVHQTHFKQSVEAARRFFEPEAILDRGELLDLQRLAGAALAGHPLALAAYASFLGEASANLLRQLEKLETENAHLRAENMRLQRELAQAEKTLVDLRTDLDKARKAAADLQKENERLQQELERANRTSADLKRQLADWSNRFKRIEEHWLGKQVLKMWGDRPRAA